MLRTLRSALVSGFLILLPALLAYLLIGGFYDLLVLITQPISDLLPRYGVLPAWGRQLVQIGMLGVVFIAVGLIRYTGPAKRLGAWFENEIFGKFPPYRVVRDITRRLGGEEVPNMQAALVTVGPEQQTVGFIVEELPNKLVSVFLPLTSVPTLGQLRIMPRSAVEPLQIGFLDAAGWYFNWGAGTEAILRGRPESGEQRRWQEGEGPSVPPPPGGVS
jgi:uncharacterized membrane protein